MAHSDDVQKIHTHYLAASSRHESCEFTAGALANSDIQHRACVTSRVQSRKLTSRKGCQKDLLIFFFLFFIIKTPDVFFFLTITSRTTHGGRTEFSNVPSVQAPYFLLLQWIAWAPYSVVLKLSLSQSFVSQYVLYLLPCFYLIDKHSHCTETFWCSPFITNSSVSILHHSLH